jgi:hypothetical protein
MNVVVKDGKNYYACGYRRGGLGDSECSAFKEESSKQELTRCICDDKALFWGGCKCWWIEKERAAKV